MSATSAQVGGARSNRLSLALALVVGVGSLAILVGTSRDFGMVWDEGHTVRRDRLLAAWFDLLADPPAGKSSIEALSPANLRSYWPFSRAEPDGHPPFYALLGVAGERLTHGLLDPLTAYRFGPMALAAVAVGAVFHHLWRRFGPQAAVLGSFGFLYLPRTFAHAHYAHYDMPMTCLWILAQIALANALESGRIRAGVLLGLALGLCAGTKFTGWFAAVPMLAFALAQACRRALHSAEVARNAAGAGAHALKAAVIAVPTAALVLLIIQPAWWRNPIEGMHTFLVSNLTRSTSKPIPTLYWGKVYEFSLPWHNTAVLTAIATPALTVILGLFAIVSGFFGRAWGERSPGVRVWIASWLALMVVRALPNAPGHDGVRLFLPSIASLGILAGIGASLFGRLLPLRLGKISAWVLTAAAIAESLIGIARLYPYTMSYYNSAFGGLRAAESRGFELTYYYDTIGPEFLAWVRGEAGKRKVELRFPSDLVNVPYLREWGLLPADIPVVGIEAVRAPDYVLQRRRGVYYPYDWRLDTHGAPRFRIAREGVDLLRVYSFDESFKAFEATRDIPIPDYLDH